MCLQCRRPGFNPWVWKIPWSKKMATHSSILAWRIIDRGACWATVHVVAKSWTGLSNEHFHFQRQKQLKWMDKLWYVQTTYHCSSIKRYEVLIYVTHVQTSKTLTLKWKKPFEKGYTWYDSTYMKYLELVKFFGDRKQIGGCPRPGWRENSEWLPTGHGFLFGVMECSGTR